MYMPPLCDPVSIFPGLWPHDAISTHRGQKRSGQAGLEQPGAAGHTRVMPTLQDTSKGQSGVPWVKHGSQHHSGGRLGCCPPARDPQGAMTHCPWSSQRLSCSKSTSTQDQGKMGMRTQGSCCPAPSTEDPEGKHVSPADRGSFCCTGLRLFSAMTLARSWD